MPATGTEQTASAGGAKFPHRGTSRLVPGPTDTPIIGNGTSMRRGPPDKRQAGVWPPTYSPMISNASEQLRRWRCRRVSLEAPAGGGCLGSLSEPAQQPPPAGAGRVTRLHRARRGHRRHQRSEAAAEPKRGNEAASPAGAGGGPAWPNHLGNCDLPEPRNQQLPRHTRACRLSRGPRLLRTVVQHDLSELMPGASLEVVRWGNLEAEAGSARRPRLWQWPARNEVDIASVEPSAVPASAGPRQHWLSVPPP